ncbi:hypothetical protein ACFFLS_26035 [Flavobacterium procerum]|uniref:Lipoprotein n=1 Tax=Flavobacterium procerum TaxID=1455569 RepID=A0ABV6BYL3_9FLAO
MKRILIILTLFFSFLSCKKEKSEESAKLQITKSNDMNINSIDTIKKIVEQQVLHGYAVKEAGLDMQSDYDYKKEDYEIIRQLSIDILKSYNYRVLNDENFQNKVFRIFDFKDIQKDINFLVEFACPLKKTKYQLDVNYTVSNNNPLFIDSKNKIILEALYAPQLINYKTDYPDIYNKEEKIEKSKSVNGQSFDIIKWKEIPNLDEQRKKNVQTLVARNLYLFNDSRAHFKWLIVNDAIFMRSLVTTFGYYDDKELLKWGGGDKTEFTNQNIEEANKIIYNKKCDGKIVFDQQLLNILVEDEAKATQFYDFVRYYYIDWLLSDKSIELNFSQKAEIIARIHSFIYKYAKDYRTVDFMGKFAEYNDSDNKYSKEFKLKNYYNIPEFEKQWKQAKIDGDGISLPGEE